MKTTLADGVFWAAVASCVVAQVAIVRSVLVSPERPPSSPRRRGARVLEVGWAILPAFALAAVLLLTWRRLQ